MLDAAVAAIRAGHNQYPPGIGIPELRARDRRAPGAAGTALEYDPDTEVLVTAGATEAIAATLLALCEPGDEVVTFEPYYDSYAACIALAGAQRRVVHAAHARLRRSTPTRSPRAITPRTRLLLLNSPHNPTGKVFSRGELELIARLCVEHDLLAVTDEVYEHLVFDGEHVPLATLPGMRERTVTISSAGKTFSFTGWKIGWVCAPPELVDAVRTVKQFLTYVNGGAVPVRRRRRRSACPTRYFRRLAADAGGASATGSAPGSPTPASPCCRPPGTYFVTADIRPLGETDGLAFCRSLPERCGVVGVPSVGVLRRQGRRAARWCASRSASAST